MRCLSVIVAANNGLIPEEHFDCDTILRITGSLFGVKNYQKYNDQRSNVLSLNHD